MNQSLIITLIAYKIIIVYTLLGGFLAVSVTDAAQGAMTVLATLVLPLLAWFPAGALRSIEMGLTSVDLQHLLTPSGTSAGLGAIGQPHLVARFMVLKDRHRRFTRDVVQLCRSTWRYYLANTPGDIAERTLPFTLGFVVLLLHRQRAVSRPAMDNA